LIFDEVTAIEELDEETTFDVHMPETHSFISNSIVNHNTEIAAGIMKLILPQLKKGQRILFFTHSKEIFHQTAERLEKRLRTPVGKIGDGTWREEKITIVMIPTINRKMSKPSTKLADK